METKNNEEILKNVIDMEDDSDETTQSKKTWVGTPMEEIYKNHGPWQFEIPLIHPSKYHLVLYELPPNLQNPPKPHHSAQTKTWDDDHIKMPFSSKNLFPVKKLGGEEVLKPRWQLIKEALNRPINSSEELETAIHSYNTKLPKFVALHHLFNEVLEKYETEQFFRTLLPGIIRLALQLPSIVPGNVPLLKKEMNLSVSLSQMQVASLLANAFLCTFPWRRDMSTYPGVNFSRLYSAHLGNDNYIPEKLKCILHYFRRILKKPPPGVLTFKRKYMPKSQMPRWDKLENNLGNTRVHISSSGTIEDNGLGLLQVDFANKYVGGGVLGYGCVQEEIRFLICPELLISRLFTEELGNTESLIMIGAERFSNYTGYADTFQWSGNCDDPTPYDGSARKQTTIVAIDAIYFSKPINQFNRAYVLREVNKTYIGFHSRQPYQLPAVATGNWGCGAFRGNPHIKFLIQLMACSATNRDMVYYTFNDEKLKDTLYNMYTFIATNSITISQLWKLICKFEPSKLPADQFFPFIQQAYFDSKNQLTLKSFFSFSKKNNGGQSNPSSSSNFSELFRGEGETSKNTKPPDPDLQKLLSDEFNFDVDSDLSDVIESSQKEESFRKLSDAKSTSKKSTYIKIPEVKTTGNIENVNILEETKVNEDINAHKDKNAHKDDIKTHESTNTHQDAQQNTSINKEGNISLKYLEIEKKLPKNMNEIINLIDGIDGQVKRLKSVEENQIDVGLLSAFDAVGKTFVHEKKKKTDVVQGNTETVMDTEDSFEIFEKTSCNSNLNFNSSSSSTECNVIHNNSEVKHSNAEDNKNVSFNASNHKRKITDYFSQTEKS